MERRLTNLTQNKYDDDFRLIEDELYQALLQRKEMRQALQEIFDLLEEHEPPWYLVRHYKRICAILGTELKGGSNDE